MPLGTVIMRVDVGFFGKLPCRGDFLRAGLPAAFVAAWDAWASAGMARSREVLGDAWEPAWMEAPVWRFALPAGQCGPDPVLGLWMPSVDSAGRCFPLTVAAVFADGGPGRRDDGWLDRAEEAGRTALEGDGPPSALDAALRATGVPDGGAISGAQWWTDGSPRVPPTATTEATLPEPGRFAAMLASAS